MKKIILKIIFLCTIFININVYAASYSLSLESENYNVEKDSTLNAYIVLKNISGIENGINACQTSISSTSNIKINSITGINSWAVTNGSTLILDSSNGVTSYTRVANVNITVLNEGSISISSSNCTNGESEYNTNPSTINFTIKENTTTTTTTTKVVPTTTTTQIPDNTTTTTKQQTSTYFKNLEIENYEIDFEKNKLEYELKVNDNVDKINITYELEDESSTVNMIGSPELKEKENIIEYEITNPEGIKTIYKITIIKEEQNDIITNNESDILNAIEQSSNDINVKVDIDDKNKIITKEILEKLIHSKKNIIYTIYENEEAIYSFKIKGNNITEIKEINYDIKFYSDYKDLNNIIKNKVNNILNFQYRGTLPKDTEITIYNTNIKNKAYLYKYNPNKQKLEYLDSLEINNNNIKLNLDNTYEFVVLEEKNTNISMIIIISLLAIIIITLIITIYLIKRKRNQKNNQ